jgi:hypothetical protein
VDVVGSAMSAQAVIASRIADRFRMTAERSLAANLPDAQFAQCDR